MPLAVSRRVRALVGDGVRGASLALAAVLLVGLAATQPVSTSAPAPAPTAVTAVAPQPPTPTPAPHPAPDLADRLVALPPAPASRAAVPRAEPPLPDPVDRWLPSGTGMWLHEWRKSEQGHALQVVDRARRSGLTHLYVQTGSSKKGWIGQEVLSQLLPATKGTGIAVIAWDFPTLDDPEADARRLARAAFWHRDGVPMVAAVAPDVETAAEGTTITRERARRYYTELRKRLPRRTAILATVPWPSEKRVRKYPYGTTAPFADAFVPMAYWYNRDPGAVTSTSMRFLKRFGKPVMPVGQGYDGRLDAPYLLADPDPGRSVQAFIDAAHGGGARSLSLWSWQTTGAAQWTALAGASGVPTPGPAPTVTVPAPVTRPAPDLVPGRKPHPRRTSKPRVEPTSG